MRKTANAILRKLTGYELRRYRPPAQRPAVAKAPPAPKPAAPAPPKHLPPSLDDLTKLSEYLESTPAEFLESLGWARDDVAKVLGEFDEVMTRLEQRYAKTLTVFPPRWGVERGTGVTLYGLVRLLEPETIVETGVADGRSSFLMLSALERNGHGTLHSFDVRAEAGNLARGHAQWNLTISDAKDPRKSFVDALEKLDTIDLFLHDSDHGYPNQMFEYETAWPKVPEGGILASDDVDLTKAYVDFAKKVQQRPHFLFDRRKIVGAIRR